MLSWCFCAVKEKDFGNHTNQFKITTVVTAMKRPCTAPGNPIQGLDLVTGVKECFSEQVVLEMRLELPGYRLCQVVGTVVNSS